MPARRQATTSAIATSAGLPPTTRDHMAFRVPTLNLQCRIWINQPAPPFPPGRAADLTVSCQLRNPTRAQLASTAVTGSVSNALLCLPARTNVHGFTATNFSDLVEVPIGTGRYYRVLSVEDVGKGFANEYRLATIQQQTHLPGGWPDPAG